MAVKTNKPVRIAGPRDGSSTRETNINFMHLISAHHNSMRLHFRMKEDFQVPNSPLFPRVGGVVETVEFASLFEKNLQNTLKYSRICLIRHLKG